MAKGLSGKCDSPGMSEIGYQLSMCGSLIENRGPAHLCKINKSSHIHVLRLDCLVCFLSGTISAGLLVCMQPLWINKWLSGNSSATLPNDGISTVIFNLKLCLGKAGAVEAEWGSTWWKRHKFKPVLWSSKNGPCGHTAADGPGWFFPLPLKIPLRKFSQKGRLAKMTQGSDLRAGKLF